ncbi:MAG TPA: DMT family transporter [Fimbriiglobus sp.]|nr:DMT family transporter [Fimbriiglobus sp.]
MGTVPPSAARARAALALAAVLWSTGSLFMRLLREPMGLGLDRPALDPLQIAFFRGLFAGVVLVPLVRPRDVRLRPAMVGMVGCFGLMSGLYLSALGLGQAANAILLQYSAPFWVYLIGVYLLGDPADRRNWRAILLGLCGTMLIVAGNWSPGDAAHGDTSQSLVLLMGLGSGLTYAWVVLFLRGLRAESSAWLMVLNLFGSSALIGGFIVAREEWDVAQGWFTAPSAAQLAVLFVFGAVQMAAPYWLFARSLRSVSPQEAGIITLLEPVLNPVWAYLIAPDKETPTAWTVAGGLLLLGALAWRYLPVRRRLAPEG